jgi:two-component system CheB/CheR fusion protein
MAHRLAGLRGAWSQCDETLAPLDFDHLAHQESGRQRSTMRDASAERFRQMIEGVPAGVAMLDRDMRYLLVSRRWLDDFRLNEPDIIGKSHYEVFPEIPERWKEVHRRCLAGAVERCEEDPFPRLDGTIDWTRWQVNPWYEDGGEIGGIVIYEELITDRKRAEMALRESESRFKLLHRLAVGAVASRSEQEILGHLLEAALEVTGAQRGVLQIYDERTDTLRILIDHGLSQPFIQVFAAVDRGASTTCGEALRRKCRVVVEDVSRSPIFAGQPALRILEQEEIRAIQATPIISRQGKVLGVCSTFWRHHHRPDEATLLTLDLLAVDAAEIIHRKQAEQALSESERRLKLALKVARLGFYELAVPTGEVHWDGRVRELWGVGPEEPITFESFARTIHPDDRDLMQAVVQQTLVSGDTRQQHAEYRMIRADGGATRWISSNAIAEFADGHPMRVLGTVEDITERKQADEALKRSEALLRDSNARLAEADRRKDEFLAMLAHELRNPLAAITLAIDFLGSGPEAEPGAQKAGELIQRQTRQLVRMVNDLLEVSRVTRGKLTLRKQQTTVMSVVNQAVETSRPAMESRRLQLQVVLPPEPVALEADTARLAQALVNLLNNAAKYSPPGGQISLTTAREGDQVMFRVKDTGIGIPPEMLEPIFEMFVQSSPSLDRSQGGLGLGLPLVRHIVELHQGTVRAFSEGPGKGSEFVIRVPAGDVVPEHPTPGPPGAAFRARPCRILVVDDNRDVAEGLATVLKSSGHEVRLAHDGLAAVAVAAAFRPEVVFLDIGLPLLDGYEVARQLRRLPGLDRFAIIGLSGYGELADRERSREAGFDLHLVKPVDRDRLDEVLGSVTAQVAGAHPEGSATLEV